jgi:hypothetical protein
MKKKVITYARRHIYADDFFDYADAYLARRPCADGHRRHNTARGHRPLDCLP